MSRILKPSPFGFEPELRWRIASSGGEPRNACLEIAFEGGVCGRPDGSGDFDSSRDRPGEVVTWATTAWPADALILDCSALTYIWGDEMSAVIQGERLGVVVSERCREGLTSLVRDECGRDPNSVIFGSKEEAQLALLGPSAPKPNRPRTLDEHQGLRVRFSTGQWDDVYLDVIHLEGVLAEGNAPYAIGAVECKTMHSVESFILDLSGVTRADASVVPVAARFAQLCGGEGKSIVRQLFGHRSDAVAIVVASPPIARLLDAVLIDKVQTLQDAIRRIGG